MSSLVKLPPPWPASSTTISRLPGQARCRSHAVSSGPGYVVTAMDQHGRRGVQAVHAVADLVVGEEAGVAPVVRYEPCEDHPEPRVLIPLGGGPSGHQLRPGRSGQRWTTRACPVRGTAPAGSAWCRASSGSLTPVPDWRRSWSARRRRRDRSTRCSSRPGPGRLRRVLARPAGRACTRRVCMQWCRAGYCPVDDRSRPLGVGHAVTDEPPAPDQLLTNAQLGHRAAPFTFGASRKRRGRHLSLARHVLADLRPPTCDYQRAEPRSYPPAGQCKWPVGGLPARLLSRPRPVRVSGGAEDVHVAVADIHREQHVDP
jgi:hypothetical protein